jgi:hypothetical protein
MWSSLLIIYPAVLMIVGEARSDRREGASLRLADFSERILRNPAKLKTKAMF